MRRAVTSGYKFVATIIRPGRSYRYHSVVETHMKTHLAVEADPQADFAAADLEMQIKALFEVCPNLCGFVVEDLGGLHGDTEPNERENGIAITQVSFGALSSQDESQQVCSLIISVISELVTEQPEAYELLRDRTFARTLH